MTNINTPPVLTENIYHMLISGLLHLEDAELVRKISQKLKPGMIQNKAARQVYELIVKAAHSGAVASFDIMNKADMLGFNISFLEHLDYKETGIVSSDILKMSSDIIDYNYRMELWRRGHRIAAISHDYTKSMKDMDIQLRREIDASLQRYSDVDYESIVEVMALLDEKIKYYKEQSNTMRWGIDALDSKVNIYPGYYIVCGRMKHGKSAFATTIALNVAESNFGVAYWTGEMRKEELLARMICQLSGITYLHVIGKRTMDPFQYDNYKKARDIIVGLPIHIWDGRAYVNDLEQWIMQLRKEGKRIDMLIIDQVSFLNKHVNRHMNTEQVWTQCSREIQAMYKKLNIPIFTLAQLNTKDTSQKGKFPRPDMYDIKYASSLIEDCDSCYLIDRPESSVDRLEYIHEKTGIDYTGRIIISCTATRNFGMTFSVVCKFNRNSARVEDL